MGVRVTAMYMKYVGKADAHVRATVIHGGSNVSKRDPHDFDDPPRSR